MPSKRALLIGLNYANTSHALAGCINDVHSMDELLTGHHYTCMRMVDDGSVAARMRPTRKNLLRELRALVAAAQAGDCLVVHYSGHGTYTRDANNDEHDGRDEALCPADGGVITDDELRCVLVDRLPPGVQLVMILDCCHSGTGADLRFNYELDVPSHVVRSASRFVYSPTDAYTPRRRVNSKCRSTSAGSMVVCISGCRDRQTSADTVIANRACGAMTAAFLEAWEHVTASTTSTSSSSTQSSIPSSIPLRDIIQYMTGMLRVNGYTQIPQLSLGHECMDEQFMANTARLQL